MGSVYRDEILGWWYGTLPRGCELCMQGLKVVVFVTGLCGVNCFYCPLSLERRRVDAFYVDEERVEDLSDILDEIAFVRARGISITGGEPLHVIDRVVDIIELVKSVYGSRFHVHLYTTGLGASPTVFKTLERVGLDELRFHVVDEWVWKYVEIAVHNLSIDIGIEIPALPDMNAVLGVIERAARLGVKFVNLNELEVSETNIESLLLRGLRVGDDGRTVVGSADVAKRAVEFAAEQNLKVSVHFCPAVFKDRVQHRYRLLRKAITCAGPDMEVEDDGLLIKEGREFIPLFNSCAITIRNWGDRSGRED